MCWNERPLIPAFSPVGVTVAGGRMRGNGGPTQGVAVRKDSRCPALRNVAP